ncbi:hypothetical protein CWI37_0911p0010 [Hamiltosporidium tvaerminnensis]|uniref:Lipoprotein n=1 Tax=Hamiltosporidium tvaerminnensis TaxID=1176355 RepID=A0A4Q9L0B0_9MICR|nr:hypothetical protein LUQ84_003406 [Hamiltosporidium tvaerminnensis]TBU00754.1 hypothetical protein CWI37_0911p0010 [Hamiltosporidium tvaerminnensis]
MYWIINRTLLFLATIISGCNESIKHSDYILSNTKENQSIFFNLINKGTEVFSILYRSTEERKIVKKEIFLYFKQVQENILKPENKNIFKIYTFSKFYLIFLQNFILQNINLLKEKINEKFFIKNIYLFPKLLEIRTYIDFLKIVFFSEYFRKPHVFLYFGIKKIFFFSIESYKRFQILNNKYEEIENNTEKVFFGIFLDLIEIFYKLIDPNTKLNTSEKIQIRLERMKYHIRIKLATFLYKSYILVSNKTLRIFKQQISPKIFNFKYFLKTLNYRISQKIDINRIYYEDLVFKTLITIKNIISQQIATKIIFLENISKEIQKLIFYEIPETTKKFFFYLKNILKNLHQTYKKLKNISLKLKLKIKNSEYKIEINPLNTHFLNQIRNKILKIFQKINIFSIEFSYEKENIKENEIEVK